MDMLLSILSAIGSCYGLGKDIFIKVTSPRKLENILSISTNTPQLSSVPEKVSMGQRHKYLREEKLKIDSFHMSKFYNLEFESQLLNFEKGMAEFPIKLIYKLTSTFFVREKYLTQGIEPIFNSFDLISGSDECYELLKEGFYPVIFCSPKFEDQGLVYVFLYKQEDMYVRSVQSSSCSFHGNGGGVRNVHHLIDAMLKVGTIQDIPYVSIYNATPKEWEEIESGCWYGGKSLKYSISSNMEARETFENWFKGAREHYLQFCI